MKRYSNLYERMVSVDNCRTAIYNAAKKKHKRVYVTRVLDNIDYYAQDLSNRLINLCFTSPYKLKDIEDGLSHKRRTIQIPAFYPDQCAHHAIMQILKPIILKSAYHYTCANIPGRGMDYCSKAMERVTKGIEYDKNAMPHFKAKYCAKMDIHHFYPSVENGVMKQAIRRKIKDKNVLNILDTLIDTTQGLPNRQLHIAMAC